MNQPAGKELRVGIGLLAGGAVLLLLVAGIFWMREGRGLQYTVLFDDAKDLKRGDRVQISGVDVGVVQSVELHTQPTQIDVHIKIDPEHADKVRADSTAVIGGTGFPNVSGQKVLEIINSSVQPPPPPMTPKSVVKGMDNAIELGAWKLKNKFSGAKDDVVRGIERARETLKESMDQIQQLRDNPEVKETVGQLRAFVDRMRDKGKAAASQLAAEWPPLKEKMQPVLKKLSDLGREYIVDQIKQIMSQIETTLAGWRTPSSASPAGDAPTTATQSI